MEDPLGRQWLDLILKLYRYPENVHMLSLPLGIEF